jgi:predicted anti-sigma-YlaC factor YlaD
MNCDQYQEYTSQFIDGELNDISESALFHHLSVCDNCRSFLKESLNLRSELLSKNVTIVPEPLNRKFLATIKTTSRLRKPASFSVDWMKQGRMMSLRAVGFVLAVTILTSALFTSVLYRSYFASQETVVYVPTLPTVEVRGYSATTSNVPH